jgi:hypothetical protein
MTLKMDSKLETELTPEEISDDDSLTSDEKLERIKDMSGIAVVSLISSITKEADTSASGTLAIRR